MAAILPYQTIPLWIEPCLEQIREEDEREAILTPSQHVQLQTDVQQKYIATLVKGARVYLVVRLVLTYHHLISDSLSKDAVEVSENVTSKSKFVFL